MNVYPILLDILALLIICGLVWLNIRCIDFFRREKLRRSKLKPEELAKEDMDDWYDAQW